MGIISSVYKKILQRKIDKTKNIEELGNILQDVKSEKVGKELLEDFLDNSNKDLYYGNKKEYEDWDYDEETKDTGELLDEFLEKVPSAIIDETILEKLIDKMGSLHSLNKETLKKVSSLDIWKKALEDECINFSDLPEKSINPNISQEEYTKWYEDVIIDRIHESEYNRQLNSIWETLKDFQKTSRVCLEFVKDYDINDNNEHIENSNIEMLIRSLPQNIINREIFEILLSKSEQTLKLIPDKPFMGEKDEKEYQKWAEELIETKISSMEKLELQDIKNIPYKRRNEKIISIFEKRGVKIPLSAIPIASRTKKICEENLSLYYNDSIINLIPSIDVDLNNVEYEQRQEYKEWIENFPEEKKQEYRQWYERIFIEAIKNCKGDPKIPRKSGMVTENMIKAYLDKVKGGIGGIPYFLEYSNYSNEQYEKILLYGCRELPIYDTHRPGVNSFRYFDKQYITEKVAIEALKADPLYLDYIDLSQKKYEDLEKLLNKAYKRKLEEVGRDKLTPQEIEIMQKFSINNKNLFENLMLEVLNPDIVNNIGQDVLEKIVRYLPMQGELLRKYETEKSELPLLGVSIDYLKKDNEFIEPIIEQLLEKIKYVSHEKTKIIIDGITTSENPLTEEEKMIITYLILNPKQMQKVNKFSDISEFTRNENLRLDEKIKETNLTLSAAKDTYFQRILGLDFSQVINLISIYGNDTNELLDTYNNKELESYKEKAEKEALEIILKLKSLMEEKDIEKIKKAYYEAIDLEDKEKSSDRYKNGILLSKVLTRAYGKNMYEAVNDKSKEIINEKIEKTEDGKEYIVRKVSGQFNRIISVMDAYKKSDAQEENFYDKWNTSEMAKTHALCFSNISDNSFGTALNESKGNREDTVIISVNSFAPEGITAMAPYDMVSKSNQGLSTQTSRNQQFYTFNNLLNNARLVYTELDIEIQDISEEIYKKIQPTSIICFEEVNEASIKAAIELSQKLGKVVPIELIDRRELAIEKNEQIQDLLKEFKEAETLKPEIIGDIINKFGQMRHSFYDTNLFNEIVGEGEEKNENALFNKAQLNKILKEAIEIANTKIEEGSVEEGLYAIKQIQNYIREEREKRILLKDEYEKYLMTGIDSSIDFRIDEIQRHYGNEEIKTKQEYDSINILKSMESIDPSTVSQKRYFIKKFNEDELMSIEEFRTQVDFDEIQEAMNEINQKGYYSNNKIYSEEFISRILLFSSAIGNMEEIDKHTKDLLMQTGKFYACGNKLDYDGEYGEYSAKIAEKELNGEYSSDDVKIIKATIELLNINNNRDNECTSDTKNQLITELFNKYGLTTNQIESIRKIESCISDAIELDKMRNVADRKSQESDNNVFKLHRLKNKSAESLISISSELQEQLSKKRLGKYDDYIIKSLFNYEDMYDKYFRTNDQDPPDSDKDWLWELPSIINEKYLRDKYPILDLDENLDENTKLKEELTIEKDLIKNAGQIASERMAREIKEINQEIISVYKEIEKGDLGEEEVNKHDYK